MDTRAILDGLLDKSQKATNAGIRMAEEKAILPPAGDERTAMLKGVGAGALAAGAVALLFGSKGTRKFAKKAVKLGGTAAIGGLAYKAFTQWQAAQQQSAANNAAGLQIPASSTGKVLDLDQFEPGTPIADLPAIQAEVRSEAIVKAMISAARADGHIDDEEMLLIRRQIDSLALEKDVAQFLLAELNRPVDVNSIALLADSPETAAELYLASALVVDMEHPSERVYLDNLAEALNLDAQIVARLEEPLRA